MATFEIRINGIEATNSPDVKNLKNSIDNLFKNRLDIFDSFSGTFSFQITNGKIIYLYLGENINPERLSVPHLLIDGLINELNSKQREAS